MGQPGYLIDSNVVIDYLGQKLPASGMSFMNNIIDALPQISVITKIEVLGFNASDEHIQLLKNFINDVTVLDLTPLIVDETITFRKNFKIKIPDAIIAATALTNNLTLLTRKTNDFINISELKVIDPHKI